jgi:hypothetical protein
MTDFLLPRKERGRKRAIYARAHKALADLTEALRDMREFTHDVKPLYDALGDKAWPSDNAIQHTLDHLHHLELWQGGRSVEDILSAFNNIREEI